MSARAFSAQAPSKVKLWNSGSCPYAQRVWLTLLEKEVPFEHNIVDLQNKPPDFTNLYASITADPESRAKVPILEHEGEPTGPVRLVESMVCAEYVAERFSTQGTSLLPSSAYERALMRLLTETWSASGLGGYSRIVQAVLDKSNDDKTRAEELAKLDRGLGIMDKYLRKWSDPAGPYLLGPHSYCLGELCIAPFIQRMLPVLKHYLQLDLLQKTEELHLLRLKAWIEAIINRPASKESKPADDVIVDGYARMQERIKQQQQAGARSSL